MSQAERVLVSAHRGGADPAEADTRAALERALGLGVDYVELDVRRCADGTLVVVHDGSVAVDGDPRPIRELRFEELAAWAPHFLTLDAALGILAGRGRAHLDLKFRSPAAAYRDAASTHEVVAAARAVELLGPEQVLVTGGHGRGIRAVRDWADGRGLDLRAALSVGGSVAGRPLLEQVAARRGELHPGAHVAASRANAVAVNHALALAGVARQARAAGVPMLVWTVDHPVLLRYWLRPGRAWMVTTNRPGLALSIRDGRMRA